MKPRDVAKRYGCAVQKVLRWIVTGELRAVNVAASARGAKPRWFISADDLEAFEAGRRTQPLPVKRRKRNDTVIPARVAKFLATIGE